jgi:uncharacterized protein YlxW (UPF0749 family)
MKFTTIQNLFIFLISLIIGFLTFIQYKSIKEKNLEKSTNPFREIRSILETNEELKTQKVNLEEKIKTLNSKEDIYQNAQEKIEKLKILTGKKSPQNPKIEILLTGNFEIEDLIKIKNLIFNAGAVNFSINGELFSTENLSFDLAGGQILFGNTPIKPPYLIEVYGEQEKLVQILNTKTGSLKDFNKQKNKEVLISY